MVERRECSPMATAVGAFVGSAIAAAVVWPATAADWTQERMNNADADPANWILHHQNYAGWRYSKLDEINKDTVGGMRVAFTYMLGGIGGGGRHAHGTLEGTPLVDEGIMYVPDGWGVVYKLDVSSGDRVAVNWVMDPSTDKAWAADVACCGVNNRGVALWQDKVISITLDGRMIATDSENGEIVWERVIADPSVAETLTVAPQVIGDIAIVGPAGAEYGIRGWLDGTDLNTGQQVWRTHTVAGPDEPGGETWTDDWGAYANGGGSIWQQGTYDPELNLTYWGTGNPGPDYDAEIRPGDNLFTNSMLALNPQTGSIEWYFQFTPNDPYDYDEIGEGQLVDVEVGGQMRKIMIRAARNGYMYGFDRANGEFLFGKQYVNMVNWTEGLDPKTGRPLSYDPATPVQAYNRGAAPRRGTTATFCPALQGGKNWYPAAYNPELQVLYVPGTEGCSQNTVIDEAEYPIGVRGGTRKPRDRYVGRKDLVAAETDLPLTTRGSLAIIDVANGDTKVKVQLDMQPYQGILATAGGLIFHGDFAGDFVARDAETLNVVWSFNAGTAFKAPAMTYSVGGKQFIAVLAGATPRSHARRTRPMLDNFYPSNMMYVFSL